MRNFNTLEINYSRHELESGDARRQKLALQQLSRASKAGFRVPPNLAYGFFHLVGSLVLTSSDVKVVRWSLNYLALAGPRNISIPTANLAISKWDKQPDVIGSAAALLVKHDPVQFAKILSGGNFSRELLVLSALRTANISLAGPADIKIDINIADPEVLKVALLAVGLKKAPPNVFDPKFSNREIVRALGSHDDPIVSQYSVWAIAENDDLSLSDLGVSLNDIEQLPTNVQGWVYRLFGSDVTGHRLRHDMIAQGSACPELEVRRELATGLRDNYYDGLDTVVRQWYFDEAEEEVRLLLLEHMSNLSENCPYYKDLALEIYAAENKGSLVRERMELAASRTPLYGEFQRLLAETDAPLLNYSEVNFVTNNNIKNVQAGAFSVSGTATNNGNFNNLLSQEMATKAIEYLDMAAETVENLPVNAATKTQAQKAIAEAKDNPTKERLGVVASSLKSIEGMLGSVAGSGEHVVKIAGYAALILALL